MNIKKLGFTLAEILITVVVIGIVAAITIPTFIHNQRKKIIETKLETTYAQLSQCFRHSVSENGDMDEWVSNTFKGTNSTNYGDQMGAFIQRYILPYLSGATFYNKTKTLEEFGFTNGIRYPNGVTRFSASTKVRTIELNNGVILLFLLSSTTNPDTNVQTYGSFNIVAAINGASGKAITGKDIFEFSIYLASNTFTTYNCNWYTLRTAKCAYDNTNRANQLAHCKQGDAQSRMCGDLIRMDGWKISKDYPWL